MKPNVENIVKTVSSEFTQFAEINSAAGIRCNIAVSATTVLMRQNKAVADPDAVAKNVYLNVGYGPHPMANVSVRILNGQNRPKLMVEYAMTKPQFLRRPELQDAQQHLLDLVDTLQLYAEQVNSFN